MWQKFSEDARTVILLTQEEAARQFFELADVEHFLIALLRQNNGPAAQILRDAGLTLEQLRSDLLPPVVESVAGAEPKLSPRMMRLLELAADEARRLRHQTIETQHLLMAVLRKPKNTTAGKTSVGEILSGAGLHLEDLRARFREPLSDSETPIAGASATEPTQLDADNFDESSLSLLSHAQNLAYKANSKVDLELLMQAFWDLHPDWMKRLDSHSN